MSIHDQLKQIEHDKHRAVALYTRRGLFYGPLVHAGGALWQVKDNTGPWVDYTVTFKEHAVSHIYFPRRLITLDK